MNLSLLVLPLCRAGREALYRKVQMTLGSPALLDHMRPRKERCMPVQFIEAPPGIRPKKKRVMMQKITEAVEEAYYIGDTVIILREYPVDNVSHGWTYSV